MKFISIVISYKVSLQSFARIKHEKFDESFWSWKNAESEKWDENFFHKLNNFLNFHPKITAREWEDEENRSKITRNSH